jgi:inorganic pyrophosphatase
MSLDRVPAGKEVPNDCNVVIEIPMRADPIKYEVDKETGAVFVDRFMSTAMHYPCNYGYVPRTLSDDGDPCDVLVLSPMPLVTGVVVRCRPIGMLKLDDEAGGDAKILAVPIDKLSSLYHHVKSPRDLPEITTRQIAHFFEHYKDLEPGKWVRVGIWVEAEEAKREIMESVTRFERAQRGGVAKSPGAAPGKATAGKVEAKAKGKGKRKSADGGKGKTKAKARG